MAPTTSVPSLDSTTLEDGNTASSFDPLRPAVEGVCGYASQLGYADDFDYARVMQSPDAMRSVAQAYDALPAFDRSAVPLWEAMRDKVNNQYHHAVNTLGITPEFVGYDPYADVHEMVDDLTTNRRHPGGWKPTVLHRRRVRPVSVDGIDLDAETMLRCWLLTRLRPTRRPSSSAALTTRSTPRTSRLRKLSRSFW